MKSSLGIRENIVGVKLFKSEAEIPKDLVLTDKPLHYCSMIQGARREGKSFLARADQHACKGGASGIGVVQCPENIASGTLYFDKLHKCETPDVGSSIAAKMAIKTALTRTSMRLNARFRSIASPATQHH